MSSECDPVRLWQRSCICSSIPTTDFWIQHLKIWTSYHWLSRNYHRTTIYLTTKCILPLLKNCIFCRFETLPLGQWYQTQFTALYHLLVTHSWNNYHLLGTPEIIITCFVLASELMITYMVLIPELRLFKTQSPKFPWQLKGWQNGVFSCQTYEWWTCQSTKSIHSWVWMVHNVSCPWSYTLTTATSSSKKQNCMQCPVMNIKDPQKKTEFFLLL